MSERLLVIEGIDGSGKSTVAKRICERFPSVRLISPKSVEAHHPYVSDVMKRLSHIIWPPEEIKAFAGEFPNAFWLHLQAVWYQLMQEELHELENTRPERLVSDGWYFKFMGKMMLHGYEYSFLEQCFGGEVSPRHVVLLDVPPEVAWKRRASFSGYEMGALDSAARAQANLGRESFIAYQNRLSDALRTIAMNRDWTLIPVSDSMSVDDVIDVISSSSSFLSDPGDEILESEAEMTRPRL